MELCKSEGRKRRQRWYLMHHSADLVKWSLYMGVHLSKGLTDFLFHATWMRCRCHAIPAAIYIVFYYANAAQWRYSEIKDSAMSRWISPPLVPVVNLTFASIACNHLVLILAGKSFASLHQHERWVPYHRRSKKQGTIAPGPRHVGTPSGRGARSKGLDALQVPPMGIVVPYPHGVYRRGGPIFSRVQVKLWCTLL